MGKSTGRKKQERLIKPLGLMQKDIIKSARRFDIEAEGNIQLIL